MTDGIIILPADGSVVTDQAMDQLARAGQLRTLKLDVANESFESFSRLMSALSDLGHLEELYFRLADARSPHQFSDFMEAISQVDSIENLTIVTNPNHKSHGAQDIVALSKMPSLDALHLIGGTYTDEGLSTVLANHNLREFTVQATPAADAPATGSFLQQLRQSDRLETVYLHGMLNDTNNLALLAGHPSLTVLKLANVPAIESDVWQTLLSSSKISYLSLHTTSLDAASIAAIAAHDELKTLAIASTQWVGEVNLEPLASDSRLHTLSVLGCPWFGDRELLSLEALDSLGYLILYKKSLSISADAIDEFKNHRSQVHVSIR